MFKKTSCSLIKILHEMLLQYSWNNADNGFNFTVGKLEKAIEAEAAGKPAEAQQLREEAQEKEATATGATKRTKPSGAK